MNDENVKKIGAAITPIIIAKGKQIAHKINKTGQQQQQQSHFLHNCSVIAKGPINTPPIAEATIPIANNPNTKTTINGKSNNKPIRERIALLLGTSSTSLKNIRLFTSGWH